MKHLLASLILLALVGCDSLNAYNQAKDDTRRGGNYDQANAREATRQKQLKEERVGIEDKDMLVKREIQRADQRIAAQQDEARQQDALLQQALQQKRISREQYDAMKEEQRKLQSELANLRIKDANDRRSQQADPKAEAEKQRKLDDLRKRQQVLEEDLKRVMAVR